ncbi:MAG TPA: TetR/AcrR family transcriptional regulator [Acidimicrobiales bacterium]|nr:TetR/AcrR family transcriptional regulator [Acidimicrobiales bacterium]
MGARLTRRITARGVERRNQLVTEATRLFAQRGYHSTSVADIVGSLGVGKGVFYWYFDSKEALFVHILRTGQQELRRLQDAAIAGETDPIRRIELGLRASITWADERPELSQLVQFAANDSLFADRVRRGEEIAVADVAAHLQEAIEAGRIHHDDPVMLAHAMVGTLGHLYRTFVQGAGRDATEVADDLVSFCLYGAFGKQP